jgi:hypothetical protein
MTALFPREPVGPGHFLEIVVESTDLLDSSVRRDPRRNEYDPLGRTYYVWPVEGELLITLVRNGTPEQMAFESFDSTFAEVPSLANVVPGDDMRMIDPDELTYSKARLKLPRRDGGARLSAERDNNCDWEFYGIENRKKVASRVRASVSGVQGVTLKYGKGEIKQWIKLVDGAGAPTDGSVEVFLRNVPPPQAANPRLMPHFKMYYDLALSKNGIKAGREHTPFCRPVKQSKGADTQEHEAGDVMENYFYYGRPVSCAVCQACNP